MLAVSLTQETFFTHPLNILTSGVLISIPHPVVLGLLGPHSSEEDVQPPGPVHRRPALAPGHPGRSAHRRGALWLLEALGENDRGGVSTAPVVQTGTQSSAFYPIQTGQCEERQKGS